MAKYSVQGCGNFYHHYPRIAAIVTVHSEGKDNAMTAAWHSPISHTPPIFGVSVSPKRYSYKLIKTSKAFGINFLPFDKAALIVSIGSVSGADVDKFKKFGVKTEKSIRTAVPILKDAYATYECRLIDSKEYGDHIWIVGEIVATHFDKTLFTKEETIDLTSVSPVLYMGADRYTIPSGAEVKVIERSR